MGFLFLVWPSGNGILLDGFNRNSMSGFYHCHKCSNEFYLRKKEEKKCPQCGSIDIEWFEDCLIEKELPW